MQQTNKYSNATNKQKATSLFGFTLHYKAGVMFVFSHLNKGKIQIEIQIHDC